MWQWAPRSSLDQSLPNRSRISRRDRREGTNISPRDPWLWWGRRRRARDKGEGRERDGERERKEWLRETERRRKRENGRFLGGNEILQRAGFKQRLSGVFAALGAVISLLSRSSGLVQSNAWETLMIWQLHRGGEKKPPSHSAMSVSLFIAP